ncbi:alanine/glycine:cation symporter family protein [Lachnospiraceae bacterium LCP25S3_G4]
MEGFSNLITGFSDILWNTVLIFLLCGTGIWFTFTLKFVQIRRFKDGFQKTFGGMFKKGEKSGNDGISSFQALTTAIAAQVGTGNLAGAATALAAGGAGAIFWMWLSAFFGMATIYAEALMAQKFKTEIDGQVTGGPVYYIKGAFKGTFGKVLASIFAVLIIFALGFMGNAVQANSIGDAFATAFGINPIIVGVIIAGIAFFIFAGGITRIASVTEKFVPIMALFYIIGSVIVISVHYRAIPGAFHDIFVGAFAPQAIAGGVIGVTIQKAMRFGVARGLFSNEAGMGSTPHAHAVAKVAHPGDQGCVAIVSVFIDTFVILTLTALVVLTSGTLRPDGSLIGTALTQSAFSTVFGSFGNIFIAICMFFFAFSTIIGWYFFGEANVKYLFGTKAVKVYAILVCVMVVIGSTLKVELVWSMADLFNGLMVIPNLVALLALSGLVWKVSAEYDQIKKNQKKQDK